MHLQSTCSIVYLLLLLSINAQAPSPELVQEINAQMRKQILEVVAQAKVAANQAQTGDQGVQPESGSITVTSVNGEKPIVVRTGSAAVPAGNGILRPPKKVSSHRARPSTHAHAETRPMENPGAAVKTSRGQTGVSEGNMEVPKPKIQSAPTMGNRKGTAAPATQPKDSAPKPVTNQERSANTASRNQSAQSGVGGKCDLVKGEDLPTGGASDHAAPKNGRTLNKGELDSIQKALSVPDVQYFIKKLQNIPNSLNPGLSEIGGYIVMSTAMKLKMMPASKWEGCDAGDSATRNIVAADSCEQTAGRVYGKLKVAGRNGDGATVRQILEKNGGDTFGLCDEMLAALWGGNEHQQLHNTLLHPDMHKEGAPLTDADSVFHAVHITSLSDGVAAVNPTVDAQLDDDLGGFNNSGGWPEAHWFQSALNYVRLFPEAF